MNDKSSECTARNVRSQLQFLSKAKADHWQSIAKLAITLLTNEQNMPSHCRDWKHLIDLCFTLVNILWLDPF
jgi:hypothetical protein